MRVHFVTILAGKNVHLPDIKTPITAPKLIHGTTIP